MRGVPAFYESRHGSKLAGPADTSKRSRLLKYETPKSEAQIEAGASECATSGLTYLALPALPDDPLRMPGSPGRHSSVVSFSKSSEFARWSGALMKTRLGVPVCREIRRVGPVSPLPEPVEVIDAPKVGSPKFQSRVSAFGRPVSQSRRRLEARCLRGFLLGCIRGPSTLG